jgi:hypothetical protein
MSGDSFKTASTSSEVGMKARIQYGALPAAGWVGSAGLVFHAATAWLNVERKDEQRVSTVLCRSPIDETAALYEGVEDLLIGLLELRRMVDVE